MPFGTVEGIENEIELPLLERPGMIYVGAAVVWAEALVKENADSMARKNAFQTEAVFIPGTEAAA